MPRRRALIVTLGVLVLLAAYADRTPANLQASNAAVFPDLIQMPANFCPEGIAVGNPHTFYVGSLAAGPGCAVGQILVGDLRTGTYSELVSPTGRPAVGIKYDSRSTLLYVAGGRSGSGTVYDAFSGDEIRLYQFQPPGTALINDVVLTRDAAYFTDSPNPFLYRVALAPRGEPSAGFTAIPLPLDFATPGPYNPAVKGNGLAATANGKFLILVHTGLGTLYRMDTSTFETVPVDLSGGDGTAGGNGDGLLLDGKTLYVVKNTQNKVAVINMAPDYLSGVITEYITEPFASNADIQVPTTIAQFGNSLYAVTAGFAPPAPDFVVRLPK